MHKSGSIDVKNIIEKLSARNYTKVLGDIQKLSIPPNSAMATGTGIHKNTCSLGVVKNSIFIRADNLVTSEERPAVFITQLKAGNCGGDSVCNEFDFPNGTVEIPHAGISSILGKSENTTVRRRVRGKTTILDPPKTGIDILRSFPSWESVKSWKSTTGAIRSKLDIRIFDSLTQKVTPDGKDGQAKTV